MISWEPMYRIHAASFTIPNIVAAINNYARCSRLRGNFYSEGHPARIFLAVGRNAIVSARALDGEVIMRLVRPSAGRFVRSHS